MVSSTNISVKTIVNVDLKGYTFSGSAQESDNLPERPAFSENWPWLAWEGAGTRLDEGFGMAWIQGLSDGD